MEGLPMTRRRSVAAQEVPEDLMTMREAANKVKLSVRTLERLIATGDLRAYRVGARSVRVDPNDLAELVRPIAVAGGAA
ncbi:helix-turn-helix domain-containing protein [Nocardia sp. NPDC046473]|uniref:helix-turn-helix domain-containing protein n=1 Tax=Nocardia sp. NPDC046473 TaxID=3155733 RepID=UPI0033C71392